MPADRLFHARLGHSAKVSRLSDLAFRVWATYLLAADDFGVMRADAVAFQAAHDALRERPAEEVAASIEGLVEVGLAEAFEHQGARYLYQRDWQDFQRVRFPGRTLHPLPAEAMVSGRTLHLWSAHPGGTRLPATAKGAFAASAPLRKFSRSSSVPIRDNFRTTSEVVPHNFGTASEVVPHQRSGADSKSEAVPGGPERRSRTASEAVQNNFRTTSEEVPSHARACETANGLRLTASGEERGAGGEEAAGASATDTASRAAALVERYRAELYPRHRGVAYAPTRAVEASDADAAERLCQAWNDAELDRLVERFLTAEGDRFLDGRTRTLSMLLSRAPALAEQLQGRRDGAARSTEPREAYDAVIERAKS
ncbi:MAG: hypothetical protein OXF93_05190 [Acidobacteria bacterium]|nr:hypothetical protein [Acidobacteriota bacterium]